MTSLEQLNKPRQSEKRLGATSLKNVLKSESFYTVPRTRDEKIFFVFCEYGDFLKGILLSKHSNAHINRTCSYRLKVWEGRQAGVDMAVKEGQVEEFFANKRTQAIIDKSELIGSLVRIVFIGRQKTNFGGHSAKVYDILKDKGVESNQEVLQDGPKRKTRTARPRTRAKSGRERGRRARARASAKV